MYFKNSTRTLNFIGLLLSIILLLGAYYLEYVKGQTPCLLCILQRSALMLLMVIFLIGAIHAPRYWGRYIYGILIMLFSAAGLTAAIRQTWLQHQPPAATETCVPGLNFLLQTRPLPEVIKLMFHGGRDCAEVLWRIFGLTLAEWTSIFFIVFFILGVLHFVRYRNRRGNS